MGREEKTNKRYLREIKIKRDSEQVKYKGSLKFGSEVNTSAWGVAARNDG